MRRQLTLCVSFSPRAFCSRLPAARSASCVARALLDALVRLAPSGLPRTDLIVMAGTPLLVGAAVTAATVVLFGVVPSFAVLRFDLSSPLRSDSRSGTKGRRLRKVRQLLVASQIALAVVVLAGAGLLVRSLARLTSLDMGYATEHLTMLNFSLPWRQYSDDCRPKSIMTTAADSARWFRCSNESNFTAHERVMANLKAVPGVESLFARGRPAVPRLECVDGPYGSEEQTDAESRANPWFGFDAVGPEYFKALGVPLVDGRGSLRPIARTRRAS